MPDCAVGLMAKFPQKGKVKTRLGSDIGNDMALKVYENLLNNAAGTLITLPENTFLTSAFIDPPEFVDEFRAIYQNMKKYYHQDGIDLGMRMNNALTKLLNLDKIDKAILIGADIPEIDIDVIKEAYKALETNDLVLGPTYDGGYYLIGMKQIHNNLFSDIEWSTNSVFNKTSEIAQGDNLTTGILKRLHDLDNLTDLKRFYKYYSIIE